MKGDYMNPDLAMIQASEL